MNRNGWRLIGIFFFFWTLLSCPSMGDRACAAETGATPSYDAFKEALTAALTQEKDSITLLTEELEQAEGQGSAFAMEMNAYHMQISTHGNLLSIRDTPIKDLEKAGAQNRLALEAVLLKMAENNKKLEQITQQQEQNKQKQALNEEQLSRLPTFSTKKSNARAVETSLKTLLSDLKNKEALLEKLGKIYQSNTEALQGVRDGLVSMAQDFEVQISLKKKEQLFERAETPLTSMSWQGLRVDLSDTKQSLILVGTMRFWVELFRTLAGSENEWYVVRILVVVGAIFFLFRGRKFLKRQLLLPSMRNNGWLKIGAMLLARSFPLLGLTLFLHVYVRMYRYENLPLVRMLFSILMSLLITRWAMDFLILLTREGRLSLPPRLHARLKGLIVSLRYFAVVYAVADFLLIGADVLLATFRLLLWIVLLVAGSVFFKGATKLLPPEDKKIAKWKKITEAGVMGVLIIGAFMELAGYGPLALYWQVSWAKSLVMGLLGFLTFKAMVEWDDKLEADRDAGGDDDGKGQQIQWIASRFCWLLWLVSITFAFLFAWGARKPLMDGFFKVVTYPIAFGQMHFSLMGILYSVLVLFITQFLARMFRHVLKEKVLNTNNFEYGLKESIATIGSYLIWGLGILIALHVFGLNTATLTVALGGLGIGLGFGLQTIFNNFISGIILLFERPIQVGDDVEVGGIWATVKKINVRSTIVQTADNASLIIPNSEFVSARVTNWSFKDKRVRRKVRVGVAYGADVELARATLLEVADQVPRILKTPVPDVLFTDFGDSALIFDLRFWTHISYMLSTETAVRFAINRRFAEEGIEIAYPQMDVHLFQKGSTPT